MEEVKKQNILSRINFRDQRVLMVGVILLITIVVSLISPKFVEIRNIVAIFQQVTVLGILTMAMGLLLISGGIDLSIGNIMVLSGVVISKVITGEEYRRGNCLRPPHRLSLRLCQWSDHCQESLSAFNHHFGDSQIFWAHR